MGQPYWNADTGQLVNEDGSRYESIWSGNQDMINKLRDAGQIQNYKPMYQQADEKMPEYLSAVDPATGLLKSQYQQTYTPIAGGNVWEQNMMQKQGMAEREAAEAARANQSSQWATARSNLAMRGGLGGGSAERLAAQSARQGMFDQQQANRTNMMARLGIGAQAEDKRIDLDKYNQQGRQAINQWNLQQALGDFQGRNQYNLNRYGNYMQGYAADRMAAATRDS